MQGGGYAASHTEVIIAAWARISEEGGGTSLFRIDSLVWQVAEGIYKNRKHPSEATSQTKKMLVGYGAKPETASRVAHELTFAL